MAVDRTLAFKLNEGTGTATLRVYGWAPPAISLGFNQSPDDFDSRKLGEAGFDLVRRPTGGRAILHINELTYCVVMRLDGKGPRSIYRFINEGLLRGLKHLGIHAELNDREYDFRKSYQNPDSIPCFSGSAKNEIQFNGKKLVGSAQRRYGNVVLQHGSLLLGPQHRRIVEFMSQCASESLARIDDQLDMRTTDAASILGKPVTFAEAAIAVRKGLEEHCGTSFKESDDPEPVTSEHFYQTTI